MLTPDLSAVADAVADHLRTARRVLAITGAGVSAESGLPTYRGVGGLYNDAGADEGFAIEDIMSGAMLRSRPELTWKHLRHIEEAGRAARPNRAHRLLAAIQGRVEGVLVLTQNVDGFHREAGSSDVIDIHGDLHRLECTGCGDARTVASYEALPPGVPRCEACGAMLRPGVVLFGEMLPAGKIGRLQAELRQGFDLYLSIGTTSVFPYIAGPILDAADARRPTVEINPGTTDLSAIVQHRLPLGAGEALEAIVERAFPGLGAQAGG